jgi:hypothetical protein
VSGSGIDCVVFVLTPISSSRTWVMVGRSACVSAVSGDEPPPWFDAGVRVMRWCCMVQERREKDIMQEIKGIKIYKYQFSSGARLVAVALLFCLFVSTFGKQKLFMILN